MLVLYYEAIPTGCGSASARQATGSFPWRDRQRQMYLYQYQYSFNMQNPHFHVSFQPYIGNMIIGNILQSIHSLHSTALLQNNFRMISFYSLTKLIKLRVLLDYKIFPHFKLFILRKLCNKMSAGVPVGL